MARSSSATRLSKRVDKSMDKSRKDNPPAGWVTPDTDRDGQHKTYAYDPHLDPRLVWAALSIMDSVHGTLLDRPNHPTL